MASLKSPKQPWWKAVAKLAGGLVRGGFYMVRNGFYLAAEAAAQASFAHYYNDIEHFVRAAVQVLMFAVG